MEKPGVIARGYGTKDVVEASRQLTGYFDRPVSTLQKGLDFG